MNEIFTKNLQPFFIQLESYQLGFYMKVANSIKPFKKNCVSIHKNALTQEFRERTSGIVNCLVSAQSRVRTNRNPFLTTFYREFSRFVDPVIKGIDKSGRLKDSAEVEAGIIKAVSVFEFVLNSIQKIIQELSYFQIGGSVPNDQYLIDEIKDAFMRFTTMSNAHKDQLSTCLAMEIRPVMAYTAFENCVVKGPTS